MQEYVVVWCRGHGNNYKTCIISYVVPRYALLKTFMKIRVGSAVKESKGAVYFGREKLGRVLVFKSGSKVEVGLNHDIKYTGGYSKDGNTVFLDRRFPKSHVFGKVRISFVASIAKHHEIVEKWMIDDGFSYEHSHRIATGVERAYVESMGVDWKSYDRLCKKEVKRILCMPLHKSPRSLDLAPYHDNKEALSEIRKTYS